MFGIDILGIFPPSIQIKLARRSFQKIREDFYRETRRDIAKLGLRNSETLITRVEKHMNRSKERGLWTWPVFSMMLMRLKTGDDVAATMKPFIPTDEYTLLDISRDSQKKDAVERGFALAEASAASKAILKNAVSLEVSYPVLILCSVFLYSMLFGGAVFPEVVDVKPVDTWPAFGQMLYAIDTFNYRHWFVIACIVVGAVIGYYKTIEIWSGPIRTKVDAIPLLYRNNRDVKAAQLLIALAALFESGLNFRQALARLLQTADPWLAWHLRQMGDRLTAEPDLPMAAFATGLFSTMVIDKVTDAAGRDQFEEAVMDLGTKSLTEIVDAVKKNAKTVHLYLLGIAGLTFIVIGLGSYIATGLAAMTAFNSLH